MKAPAFQWYAADYLADEHVQMMTLEEEGIYIRLLSYCWREGSIPADPESAAKLVGKGASTTLTRVVQARFNQDPTNASRMVHPRLEVEREKQRNWHDKSAEGGKISAQIRANKRLTESKGGSTTLARVVQPKVNSSSSSSSSSSIKNMSGSQSSPDAPPPQKAKEALEAEEILSHLNAKTGSRFRAQKASLGPIMARLKDGATPADCRAVIEDRCQKWGTNPKMREYLRPSTLFAPQKFAEYLGQVGAARPVEVIVPCGAFAEAPITPSTQLV